jgi:hypothetical protein
MTNPGSNEEIEPKNNKFRRNRSLPHFNIKNLSAHQVKMATIELIKEALLALKDRTGSSVHAINKWIESEKKVSHQIVVFSRVFKFQRKRATITRPE